MMGKFYHAVIIEAPSTASREYPKSSETLRSGGIFLPDHSLLMAVCLHRTPQLRTAMSRVSLCKGLCAPPLGQVAPYTPKGLKCGVEGFVCDCRGKRFFKNPNDKTECGHGEAGQFTQPPRAFPDPDSAQFCLIRLRQNTQGKGSPDVRFKSSRLRNCQA